MLKTEQIHITLKPRSRGFHLITEEIINQIPELKEFSKGLVNIFVLHTSCSLSISENADPTVRADLETYFSETVPENSNLYLHKYEGLDDMTSHIKNVMIGSSLNIPVSKGKLNLGTWQGIYLCEHRNQSHSRKLVITVIGE